MNDADRLGGGADIVNAEDGGAVKHSVDDAGHGTGIAGGRIRNAEDVANDGLPRNREQDGTIELREAIQFAVDAEIVGALLGEIDAGIENEGIAGNTGPRREGDFFREEGLEPAHDIIVADMGVRDFR